MSQHSAGIRFRQVVKESNPPTVIGRVNIYFARLATQSSFKVICLSGGSVAIYSYSTPDSGITAMEDVLVDTQHITDNVDTPLLAGIDVGWGGALSIARAIRNLGRAGVATIHIEDQVAQKRYGHHPNEAIISKDEMADRIKAAIDTRADGNSVIMAHADALAVEGLDAAIERAQACVGAGADMIFPEAMTDLEVYRQFVGAVKAPILANITESGATPFYMQSELAESGVSLVPYPLSSFHATSEATLNVYETIMRDGTQTAVVDTMQTRAELYEHLSYHAFKQKLDKLSQK